jgi:hypothetical protein
MTPAEIYMGLGAIKSAFDIAKGLKDIDDATRRNAAVIELQEKILVAQEAQSTLINRISELEKEMARFETWEAEKQRYQLQNLPPGMFVYTLKPAMAGGEPPHRICEKCYQNGKKSLLHSFGSQGGFETLRCFGCNTDFHVGKGEALYRSDYDPFWDDDGNPRR